jgi:ribosome biogenesis GTPase / thiamine phosphate phosphatase
MLLIHGAIQLNTNIFRVLEDRGTSFLVTQDGEQTWTAEISGNLKKSDSELQPTVGDWVQGVWQPGDWIYIEAVEPRQNLLARQDSKGGGLQKLGANLDYLFIATALNQDFNLNRLERFVAMSFTCGIQPVILLTKVDLVENPIEFIETTAARFPGIDVHGISATENWNIDSLKAYLQAGLTVGLVGSSGVGKSTLTNRLLGQEMMDTGGIRENDGRGRHTTTHRSLHLLQSSAWLMDTPGLRSLNIWDADEGLGELFQDIEKRSQNCKFTDCQHRSEPGCQILQALENGDLEAGRWENYLKLKKEEDFQKRKNDKHAASVERKRWKSITQSLREKNKSRWNE